MDIRAQEGAVKKGIEVFCCYARKDQPLLLNLKVHLTPLVREGLITLWADVNIDAGIEWEKEIHHHLNTARIILLLISPDFIASEYCYSVEMRRAMERHERTEARVIPIILRPVSWQRTPFGKLQALPTDAIPITSGKWHHQDEAFYQVAEGIREAVEARLAEEERVRRDEEVKQAHLTEEETSHLERRSLDQSEGGIIAPLEQIEASRKVSSKQQEHVKTEAISPTLHSIKSPNQILQSFWSKVSVFFPRRPIAGAQKQAQLGPEPLAKKRLHLVAPRKFLLIGVLVTIFICSSIIGFKLVSTPQLKASYISIPQASSPGSGYTLRWTTKSENRLQGTFSITLGYAPNPTSTPNYTDSCSGTINSNNISLICDNSTDQFNTYTLRGMIYPDGHIQFFSTSDSVGEYTFQPN